MGAEVHGVSEQIRLYEMYNKGQGVPQDYKEAFVWLTLAKTNGPKSPQKLWNMLTKKMTKEQIAEAESLSTEIQKRIKANRSKFGKSF